MYTRLLSLMLIWITKSCGAIFKQVCTPVTNNIIALSVLRDLTAAWEVENDQSTLIAKVDVPELAELSNQAKAHYSDQVSHYNRELSEYQHRQSRSEWRASQVSAQSEPISSASSDSDSLVMVDAPTITQPSTTTAPVATAPTTESTVASSVAAVTQVVSVLAPTESPNSQVTTTVISAPASSDTTAASGTVSAASATALQPPSAVKNAATPKQNPKRRNFWLSFPKKIYPKLLCHLTISSLTLQICSAWTKLDVIVDLK